MFLNKRNMFFVLVFLLCGDEILSQNVTCSKRSTNSEQKRSFKLSNKNRMSHIDLLMNNLKYEQWEPDERVCYEKILNVLQNVKNSTLWATWIWDSMQSTSGLLFGSRYNLGNFDQCMKAPWVKTHPAYRTQYCIVDFKLNKEEVKAIDIDPDSSVDVYTKSVSSHGVTFNEVTLGVCVPSECQKKSIGKFAKVLFEDSHLGSLPEVEITVEDCQLAGTSVEYGIEFYIAIAFLLIAVTTIITYSILKDETVNSTSLGGKLLNAFNLYTNMIYLTKTDEDDIKSVHGIRTLTSASIVIWHVWFMIIWITPGNSLQMDSDMNHYGLYNFYHLELLVDTFFMMSGLLLVNGLMKMGSFNPLIIIIKRYFRLFSVIPLLITISSATLIYIGSGPLFPKLSDMEKSPCDKNWWVTLLTLGNYVDRKNMCYPVLWSVPCDFHLTIIGTILCWTYSKNKRLGISLFSVLFLLSYILLGVYTNQNRLLAVPISNVKNIKEYRDVLHDYPIYTMSHFRAGPYFVGIVAGYIISIYKPTNYRNIISKRWSAIGYCIAQFTAIKMLTIGSAFYDNDRPYDAWDSAIFASINRSIWATAVAAMIMLCEYGDVPLMTSFYTWKAFIPLSKLSFGVYLTHFLVFAMFISEIRTPLTYGVYNIIILACGVLLVSFMISFILHIFFEAPMAKILNICLVQRSNSSSQTRKHSKTTNGIRQEATTYNKKIS